MIFLQFSNSENINKLTENLAPLLTIDPEVFRETYFDIYTCEKEGLDNWGRILNISRSITVINVYNGVFGFGRKEYYPIPATGYPQNFNNGRFFNPDYSGDSEKISLTDSQYRLVLLFRYRTLTCNMSLFSINKIINQLITEIDKTYRCHVYMSGFMQLTYSFNFILSPWIKAIFQNRNIFPVPAGVSAIILQGQNV